MNSHFFYVAPIVGHETGQFTPFLISIRAKLPARYQPSGSSGVVFWQKACLLACGYQGPFCVNEMWSRWHVWCLFLPDHVSFVREKCCPGEMAHCSSTQLTFLSLWADTYYYDTTNSCFFFKWWMWALLQVQQDKKHPVLINALFSTTVKILELWL